MAGQTVQLRLNLHTGPEVDVEELEKHTLQLKKELIELDVEAVDFVSAGESPEKVKAGDPITWGTLLLTLAASGGVLTSLISALQSWLTTRDRRSVTLEIDGDKLEVAGISSEEQRRLIDAWLSRHSRV